MTNTVTDKCPHCQGEVILHKCNRMAICFFGDCSGCNFFIHYAVEDPHYQWLSMGGQGWWEALNEKDKVEGL